MKLKYNRDIELRVPGLGIFQPNQCVPIESDDQKVRYLNSGYFDLIKEREIKKTKKIKRNKKSKKKGIDKLCQSDQEDI